MEIGLQSVKCKNVKRKKPKWGGCNNPPPLEKERVNIDLLKTESTNYSHDFLMTLQSCYLIPTVDKPTRVRSTSATLIDNIFVNFPEQVLSSGNIISDISDHFSQFCILKSAVERPNIDRRKVRDFSKFSPESFNTDLSQVKWNKIGFVVL